MQADYRLCATVYLVSSFLTTVAFLPPLSKVAGIARFSGSVGYFSNAERSSVAVSMWSAFNFVPAGSRNGNVHEYSGTDPASTNCDAVR